MKEYYIFGEEHSVREREIGTGADYLFRSFSTGFLKLEYNFRKTLFGKIKCNEVYIPVFLYTTDETKGMYYEFFTNEVFCSSWDIRCAENFKENLFRLPVSMVKYTTRGGKIVLNLPRHVSATEFLQCVTDYLKLLKKQGIDEQELRALIKKKFESAKRAREENEAARKQELLQAQTEEEIAQKKLDELSHI